jgi:hypothetical protein
LKIRYFFYELSSPANEVRPAVTYILRSAHLFDAPNTLQSAYSKYLFSSLDSDFSENRHGEFDKVLKEVGRIERLEINSYVFDGQGFIHEINKKSVLFEHAIFGVCSHWPLWSCPLAHYKIAMQGWVKFLDFPKSLDSEMIVDLPNYEMAQVTPFPPKMADKEDVFNLKHD